MPRRRLNPVENSEARRVFGSSLDYDRVIIAENTPFPNWVAAVGRAPRPNAVTLGNVSYFPETLQNSAEDIGRGNLRAMAWLIHELTHQWQFQQIGWSYLPQALWAHLRLGQASYHYSLVPGRRLAEYNLEQQGDIARDYYCALKLGQNCTRTRHLDPGTMEVLIGDFRIPALRQRR